MIDTPSVDWFALATSLALLAAAGVALLAAVIGPVWTRKAIAAGTVFVGFVVSAGFAGALFADSSSPQSLLAGSMSRDQLAAMAQVILAISGAAVVFASWTERRDGVAAEY